MVVFVLSLSFVFSNTEKVAQTVTYDLDTPLFFQLAHLQDYGRPKTIREGVSTTLVLRRGKRGYVNTRIVKPSLVSSVWTFP